MLYTLALSIIASYGHPFLVNDDYHDVVLLTIMQYCLHQGSYHAFAVRSACTGLDSGQGASLVVHEVRDQCTPRCCRDSMLCLVCCSVFLLVGPYICTCGQLNQPGKQIG